LSFLPNEDLDGDATVLLDEEQIYETMGFKAADEGTNGGEGTKEIPVLEISPELQAEMDAAAIPVNNNPDMAVGTLYPSMPEFRLAVKQHAIVKEFELGTEKSDKQRFRGFYKSEGCKWIIRARTLRDNSVRVYY